MIQQGFTGKGDGLVECDGEFQSAFIHHEKVWAKGAVTVIKEVFDSFVYSDLSVKVQGKPVSIVGGHVAALHFIEAIALGNASNTKTRIEVGKNFRIQKEIEIIQKRIISKKEIMKFLVGEIQALSEDKKFLGAISPKQTALAARALKALDFLKKQIPALESQIKILESKVYFSGECTIKAQKVFPGTLLFLKDSVLTVNEVLEGKTFFLKGNKVSF